MTLKSLSDVREGRMTTADDLLPCPFCGSRAEYDDSMGHILCEGCGFYYTVNQPAEEAFAAWNRRSAPSLAEFRERCVKVDIVFDGPPGPEAGRFVEVEDATGRSIRLGEWVKREDGYWVLRIPDPRALPIESGKGLK